MNHGLLNTADLTAAIVREGTGAANVMGLMFYDAGLAESLTPTLARLVAGADFFTLLQNCVMYDFQGNPCIRTVTAPRHLTPDGAEADSRYAGNATDHLKKCFACDGADKLALVLVETHDAEADFPDAP